LLPLRDERPELVDLVHQPLNVHVLPLHRCRQGLFEVRRGSRRLDELVVGKVALLWRGLERYLIVGVVLFVLARRRSEILVDSARRVLWRRIRHLRRRGSQI
jgi:hypothetical protein